MSAQIKSDEFTFLIEPLYVRPLINSFKQRFVNSRCAAAAIAKEIGLVGVFHFLYPGTVADEDSYIMQQFMAVSIKFIKSTRLDKTLQGSFIANSRINAAGKVVYRLIFTILSAFFDHFSHSIRADALNGLHPVLDASVHRYEF